MKMLELRDAPNRAGRSRRGGGGSNPLTPTNKLISQECACPEKRVPRFAGKLGGRVKRKGEIQLLISASWRARKRVIH